MNSIAPPANLSATQHTHTNSLDAGINPQAKVDFTLTPTADLQAATTPQTLAAPAAHVEQTPTTAETFIQTLAKVVATAPNDAQTLTREGQQNLTNSFNILLANNKAGILNLLGSKPIA